MKINPNFKLREMDGQQALKDATIWMEALKNRNDINFFWDLTNYGYICSPKVLRTW